MALALYRKYRPRTFAEVIGQEHVTEPLSQALRSGRLHHAYLFSGPRGCGKTSSARILARSLNCEQGPTPDPCGVCTSCKSLMNDGTGSIDVIEIDAASHGGVDDARDLREKAFFAPASSRFKIYVIDEAHMVSPAGFNALLKLVEEPPDYVKFIFATTEPEKVLGTIRSRTHHYPFRLIPPATLRPYLQQLTEAEGVHVEPAVLPLVVRAGAGSARDSLSVLDQLIAGAGPEGVSYARAVALLGVTDVALLDEMCDALAAGDGAAAYSTIDRVAEAGHDPRRFASDLLERFRDLIVLQQVPDAVTKGLIDGPADQLDAMSAQATRLGPAALSRCADIVHNGLVEMRGTTAPRLLLELITARMLLPGADDSTGALLQRMERMERRLTLTSDDSVRATGAPGTSSAPTMSPPPEGAPAAGGISAARAAVAAAGRRSVAAPGGDVAAGSGGGVTAGSGAAAAGEGVAADGGGRAVGSGAAAAAAGPAGAGESGETGRLSAVTVSAAPGSEADQVSPGERRASTQDTPERASAGIGGDGSDGIGTSASGGPTPGASPSAGVRAADHGGAVPSQSVPSQSVAPQSVAPQARRPEPSAVLPDAPEELPAETVAAPGQLTAAAVREVWPEIISDVGRKSKKVAALASGATVRELDGQTVVLTFRFPAHAKMVSDQPHLIVDALYEALGGRWQIRCEVAGEAGGVRPDGGPTPRGKSAPAQSSPAQSSPAQSSPAQGGVAQGGVAAPSGPAQAASPQAVSPQAVASQAGASRPRSAAPPPSETESDGDDWPEPARPGGVAVVAEAPPSEVSETAGGGSAGNGSSNANRNTPPAAVAPSSGAAVADAATAADRATAAGQVAGRATAADRVANGAPSSGRAAARAAAAAGAARQAGAKPAAAQPNGLQPNAGQANAGQPNAGQTNAGQANAGQANAGQANAGRAKAGWANPGPGNADAWADGSPTEEAPYDPEYDGPPRGVAAASPASPVSASFEGFDPGDEPLDDVIDEKTARQSSEQQAMQLLQDAFGAEKISES